MRTQTEAGRATPCVIELAGPPGAGKTALLPAIRRACEAVGLRPYTVEEAARVFARRTAFGRLAVLLPPVAAGRCLWAIFYWASMLGAVRLAVRHPRLVARVIGSQRGRPADSDAGERRVLYWFFRMAGAHAFLVRHGHADEAVIVDEGFVHRTVQLHSSAVETPDRARVVAYVDALPPTDLVVVVHAPADVCRERVQARGVWRRLRHRSDSEIARFVTNAHRAVEIAADHLRTGRRPVVEIDNSYDLTCAEVRLKTMIEDVLGPVDGRPPVRWRPPLLRVPRRGRVKAALTTRTRVQPADAAAAHAVLDQYGLTPHGRMRRIPMGRRNQNVVLRTRQGPVVLRRYRDIAAEESVRHEHEVLTELARRGFPAVRLRSAPDGRTLIEHEQRMYALFDYVHGYNLAATRTLRGTDRARNQTIAGRTLARLHTELRDYRPAAAHHLGSTPDGGAQSRDLSWYLETLATLPRREPTAGPEGRDHHLALVEMAPGIADRLVELHQRIEQAQLPTTMIHGDYGIHNLLFRRNDVAVVTDFELARRELRLIDLVIVLSRVAAPHGAAFLRGYREETSISDEEWAQLATVWQYYRLTGAIESWRNHTVHGGGRLATARRRVAEAEWAATEVASRWM